MLQKTAAIMKTRREATNNDLFRFVFLWNLFFNKYLVIPVIFLNLIWKKSQLLIQMNLFYYIRCSFYEAGVYSYTVASK